MHVPVGANMPVKPPQLYLRRFDVDWVLINSKSTYQERTKTGESAIKLYDLLKRTEAK